MRSSLIAAGSPSEPFLSTSATYVVDDPDGWTLRTSDGSLVAQMEHTMMITSEAHSSSPLEARVETEMEVLCGLELSANVGALGR
jgi:hypothetical protein